MPYPLTRMRRLRRTNALRGLVRETSLTASHLILPIFVRHGAGPGELIDGIPGHERVGISAAADLAQRAHAAGLGGVLLFGIPAAKDAVGSEAYDDEGIVQMAVRAIRVAAPELTIMTDVCMCQYTDHGHCGILDGGAVDNDRTAEMLARIAVSHARAGVDVVAPSDMMDGRVSVMRTALDEQGFTDTVILSYASKYASAFYGPFRTAAGSAPMRGDRRAYQMDPANRREAVREAELDVDEGADMLMVKPALAYLDVIAAIRERVDVPICAYNVSGEYAMLQAAAERGWVDADAALMEMLTAIRRAGADMVITYGALRAVELIRDGTGGDD